MSKHSNKVRIVQLTQVQKDKEIEMDVALLTGNTPKLLRQRQRWHRPLNSYGLYKTHFTYLQYCLFIYMIFYV